MASYTVSAGHRSIWPYTLTGSQADKITFADNVGRVQLYSDGAADLAVFPGYGNSAPTMPTGAASTPAIFMPAGSPSVLDVDLSGSLSAESQGNVDHVWVISAGTPKFGISKLL